MVIGITQSSQMELADWLGIIDTTRRRPKKIAGLVTRSFKRQEGC
jgi:hypothetical protein